MADPKPDYTGRDYDSGIERGQRVAQSVHPNWTDFNKANAGNAMLESMGHYAGVLNWNLDFWAREALPVHAELRRSVQAHSRWHGYQMQGRKAALATVTLSLPNGAHGENVTCPIGTKFGIKGATEGPEFQLLAAATITAGNTSVNASVEQSENAQDVEPSTGRANQIVRLTQSPFIEGSLLISAANGTYTKVNDFLSSLPTDRHFMVEVDDDERAVVRFGDGTLGEIPVGDVTYDYKVGGGLEGNVEAGEIGEILDPIVDALGQPIEVAVTNAAEAQGGDEAEPLARAKSNAIGSLKVPRNTISREDYEIGARTVSGVARCLFMTSNDSAFIRENDGVGWVVARGSPLPSGRYAPAAPVQALLDSVEAYWKTTKPRPFGFHVRAVGTSGTFLKTVNVTATVYLNDAANPTTIGQTLFDALRDWFAVELADGSVNPNVDFGFNRKKNDGTPRPLLAWSDIFNVIRDDAGVAKIEPGGLSLNGVIGNVTLKAWEFPILGTVTLTDGDTGAVLTHTP